MTSNFIKDAFNFRYKALLREEQSIVQGYSDGILSESYLNDFRLEIRFLESELGIKDKYVFREIENDKLVYLTDDDEYDYKDLPVLKTIEQKSMAELESTKNLIRKTKNLVNDNFKDLITEPIDVNYSWGKYGKFNIIIRNKDGFINGTFLIKEALTFENELRKNQNQNQVVKKPINDWFKNIETINLMETAKIKLGIDSLKDILKLNQYAKFPFLGGTYIHPILVNSLATWVSPSYALEINEIINNMNIEAKLKAERDRTHEILGIKNDIIAQMERRYNEISRENQIMVVNNEIRLTNILNELKTTSDSLKTTSSNLNKAVGLIEEVKYDTLYIFKVKIDNQSNTFYTCYRILEENKRKTFDKHKSYILAQQIYSKHSVNSTKAWKEFKKDKNKICIKTRDRYYNDFTLLKNYSETKLKLDLDKLFEKFDNIKF